MGYAVLRLHGILVQEAQQVLGVLIQPSHFRLAFRLRGHEHSTVIAAGADIRTWLPGDNLCDGAIALPSDLPAGQYDLAIGIVGEQSDKPKVKLAIAGADLEEWYTMGTIQVEK